MDLPAFLARRAFLRPSQRLLVLEVSQVSQDLKVTEENLVDPRLGYLARLARMETQVFQDFPDHQDHQVTSRQQKASLLANLETRAHLGKEDLRERLV